MSTHRPPNWPRHEHPYSRAPQRIEPVFIELARFNRGPRHDPEAEIMRISIDAFTPPDAPNTLHRYVTLRRWFRVEDGSYRPTREGVTIRASELRHALKKLHLAAEDLGLTEEPCESPSSLKGERDG